MPRLRRVAQPREVQSCRISHSTGATDYPTPARSTCAAEEVVEAHTLDRPTRTFIGEFQGGGDSGNVYRPERLRYPIFEVQLGTYRINYLSKPMTEQEMQHSMPLLKLSVFLYLLGFVGLVIYLLMLLRPLV